MIWHLTTLIHRSAYEGQTFHTTMGDETLNIGELCQQLDTEDMIGFTESFVSDLEIGFSVVTEERLSWLPAIKTRNWKGVLCFGMGGSAAGGDFLARLADANGSKPLVVNRTYDLPSWWTNDWLILATSHSGNTEETVAATESALKQGATVIVIATGGILAGLCELYDDCHLIPSTGGQPPRTAFGHIFSRQVAVMEHLGLLPAQSAEERKAMLERLAANNQHFDVIAQPEGDIALLATGLMEQPMAIIGPSELAPALNRFKNQMNENAARFVRIGVVPEMNHNESVAWGGVGPDGDAQAPDQALLLLTWPGMHPRVQQRLDWMVAHAPTETAWNLVGEGESLLECLLYHCLVMDWLSITLAFLHGKDPSAIGPILALKAHLESVQ